MVNTIFFIIVTILLLLINIMSMKRNAMLIDQLKTMSTWMHETLSSIIKSELEMDEDLSKIVDSIYNNKVVEDVYMIEDEDKKVM